MPTAPLRLPLPSAHRQNGETSPRTKRAGLHVRPEHDGGSVPVAGVEAVLPRYGTLLPDRSSVHGPGVLPREAEDRARRLDEQRQEYESLLYEGLL